MCAVTVRRRHMLTCDVKQAQHSHRDPTLAGFATRKDAQELR